MKARRTHAIVIFDGTNITADLQNYLLSMNYTDAEEDESDDLQLSLEDREGHWVRDWLQQSGGKGATVSATIVQEGMGGGGSLYCGTFKVDTINSNGPPDKATIKAVSIPEDNKLNDEKKTEAWENIQLSAIAGEIAGKNGMSLNFESDFDPFYERREQQKKTDIEFLKELAKDAGLSLKVTDSKIVLFDEAQYEAKAAIDIVQRGGGNLINYSFSTNFKDTGYGSCEVTYTHPKTKQTIHGSFKNPNGKNTGRVLRINSSVKNKGEADNLAKKKLREKNKKETQANLTVMGNTSYVAGVNLELKGFGLYDGKYIIQNASHSVSGSGYTTSVSMRKCLEGY